MYNPAPDVFNQENIDPLQAAKDQQDKSDANVWTKGATRTKWFSLWFS